MTAGELVERFYAAYNAGALATVEALYAVDAIHQEIAQGRETHGRKEIVAGLATFLDAVPDARWEPRHAVIGSGSAAVEYRLSGTLQGPLGPFQPAGQPLEIRGVHVLEVDGPAIRRSADYWDAADLARRLR